MVWLGVEEEHYLIGVRSQLHTSTLCTSSWCDDRRTRVCDCRSLNGETLLHFSLLFCSWKHKQVSSICAEAVFLTPQIFINTPPSLFCIIAMFKLIRSHLIAMIRLHCSHHSLRSSLPHHGFLGDLINVRCRPGLPLWIYEISDFFSFNLTPPPFLPFCICPSIIPRADLGGRVLILPSHHSLQWTDEEVDEGDGRRRRRRRGRGRGSGTLGWVFIIFSKY